MSVRRPFAVMACGLSLLAIAGCAPIAVGPASQAQPGAAVPRAAGSPEAAPPVPAAVTAAADSSPSPEALRVLAGIPEPLTPAERSLEPARAARSSADTLSPRRAMPAPEAAADTLRAQLPPENEAAAVPVPAPTRPLGSGGTPVVMPETTSAGAATGEPAAGPAGGAPPAASEPSAPAASEPAAPPASSQPATGGEAAAAKGKEPCWRMQVAAKPDRQQAATFLEAAQSLLVIPMTIVIEKGFFKVRTRDCLAREAADALKKRAIETGFSDVFLVDTSGAPPAKHSSTIQHPSRRPAQHKRVPPSRRKSGAG